MLENTESVKRGNMKNIAKVSLFLLAFLSLAHSQIDVLCPVSPIPTQMDIITTDNPAPTPDNVAVFVYNLSEHYEKSGLSHAIIYIINMTNASEPQLFYAVTGDGTDGPLGWINISYSQASDGCMNYRFIFCPWPDPSVPEHREMCLNGTLPASTIAAGATAWDGYGGTGDMALINFLPSHNELFLCNTIPKTWSQLCWPLMLIFGLLLGASFALGRNPFLAFDFSGMRMNRGKQYTMRSQSRSFDLTSALMGVDKLVGGKKGEKSLTGAAGKGLSRAMVGKSGKGGIVGGMKNAFVGKSGNKGIVGGMKKMVGATPAGQARRAGNKMQRNVDRNQKIEDRGRQTRAGQVLSAVGDAGKWTGRAAENVGRVIGKGVGSTVGLTKKGEERRDKRATEGRKTLVGQAIYNLGFGKTQAKDKGETVVIPLMGSIARATGVKSIKAQAGARKGWYESGKTVDLKGTSAARGSEAFRKSEAGSVIFTTPSILSLFMIGKIKPWDAGPSLAAGTTFAGFIRMLLENMKQSLALNLKNIGQDMLTAIKLYNAMSGLMEMSRGVGAFTTALGGTQRGGLENAPIFRGIKKFEDRQVGRIFGKDSGHMYSVGEVLGIVRGSQQIMIVSQLLNPMFTSATANLGLLMAGREKQVDTKTTVTDENGTKYTVKIENGEKAYYDSNNVKVTDTDILGQLGKAKESTVYLENKVKIIGKGETADALVKKLESAGIAISDDDKKLIKGMKEGDKPLDIEVDGKTYTVTLNGKTSKLEISTVVAEKEITIGQFKRNLDSHEKYLEMQNNALTLAVVATSFTNRATDAESQKVLAVLTENGVDKDQINEMKEQLKNPKTLTTTNKEILGDLMVAAGIISLKDKDGKVILVKGSEEYNALVDKKIADKSETGALAGIRDVMATYREAGGVARESATAIAYIRDNLGQQKEALEYMRNHADDYVEVQNGQKAYETLKMTEQFARGYYSFVATASGPMESVIKYAQDVANRKELQEKIEEQEKLVEKFKSADMAPGSSEMAVYLSAKTELEKLRKESPDYQLAEVTKQIDEQKTLVESLKPKDLDKTLATNPAELLMYSSAKAELALLEEKKAGFDAVVKGLDLTRVTSEKMMEGTRALSLGYSKILEERVAAGEVISKGLANGLDSNKIAAFADIVNAKTSEAAGLFDVNDPVTLVDKIGTTKFDMERLQSVANTTLNEINKLNLETLDNLGAGKKADEIRSTLNTLLESSNAYCSKIGTDADVEKAPQDYTNALNYSTAKLMPYMQELMLSTNLNTGYNQMAKELKKEGNLDIAKEKYEVTIDGKPYAGTASEITKSIEDQIGTNTANVVNGKLLAELQISKSINDKYDEAVKALVENGIEENTFKRSPHASSMPVLATQMEKDKAAYEELYETYKDNAVELQRINNDRLVLSKSYYVDEMKALETSQAYVKAAVFQSTTPDRWFGGYLQEPGSEQIRLIKGYGDAGGSLSVLFGVGGIDEEKLAKKAWKKDQIPMEESYQMGFDTNHVEKLKEFIETYEKTKTSEISSLRATSGSEEEMDKSEAALRNMADQFQNMQKMAIYAYATDKTRQYVDESRDYYTKLIEAGGSKVGEEVVGVDEKVASVVDYYLNKTSLVSEMPKIYQVETNEKISKDLRDYLASKVAPSEVTEQDLAKVKALEEKVEELKKKSIFDLDLDKSLSISNRKEAAEDEGTGLKDFEVKPITLHEKNESGFDISKPVWSTPKKDATQTPVDENAKAAVDKKLFEVSTGINLDKDDEENILGVKKKESIFKKKK